jgi:hypothetical protein
VRHAGMPSSNFIKRQTTNWGHILWDTVYRNANSCMLISFVSRVLFVTFDILAVADEKSSIYGFQCVNAVADRRRDAPR